jgi:hypothetical protein
MSVRVVLGAAAVALMGAMAPIGAVSAKGPDICVSVNGSVKVQKGTATCSSVASDGAANVAKAKAAGANAVAGFVEGDSKNRATASGVDSIATARNGSRNTVTASGDGSTAGVSYGDGNTVTASGDGSSAELYLSHENTVTASGDGSSAELYFTGLNTVTASGDSSTATLWFAARNTVTASGDGATAIVVYGSGNTVTATEACGAQAAYVDDQTFTCP